MKQKFTLTKDEKQKKLIIKEYAELDKDVLSLLCEETYDAEVVAGAIGGDTRTLVSVLRTKNMYPPSAHMEQIAREVIALYESDETGPRELLLNDIDLLTTEEEEEEIIEIEAEPDEDAIVDDLLDDDADDEVEADLEIKKIKTSLKIIKNDAGDGDEDD